MSGIEPLACICTIASALLLLTENIMPRQIACPIKRRLFKNIFYSLATTALLLVVLVGLAWPR